MGSLYLQQEQEEGDEDDQDDVEDAAVDGGLTVAVPEGSAGGETITIALEDGREMDIQIPDGLVAGDEFAITIEDDEEQEEQDQEEQDQEDQEEYDASEDGQDGFVALTIVCPMGSVPGDSVSIQTDRCARIAKSDRFERFRHTSGCPVVASMEMYGVRVACSVRLIYLIVCVFAPAGRWTFSSPRGWPKETSLRFTCRSTVLLRHGQIQRGKQLRLQLSSHSRQVA